MIDDLNNCCFADTEEVEVFGADENDEGGPFFGIAASRFSTLAVLDDNRVFWAGILGFVVAVGLSHFKGIPNLFFIATGFASTGGETFC